RSTRAARADVRAGRTRAQPRLLPRHLPPAEAGARVRARPRRRAARRRARAARHAHRRRLRRRPRPRRARGQARDGAGGARRGAVSGSTQTVPISVAMVAGALVALNPCSVPLLPAFLSYYLGVSGDRLPRARSGVLQGLLVGALLTLGVLGVFTVIGLPLVYGTSRIADAVPWLGLAAGCLAILAGA